MKRILGRVLITAGPTHEPIDAVRFIGNRSSGRLGVALADAAAGRGWAVTLLLGPTPRAPVDSRVRVRRFQTTAELEGLLGEEFGACDVLIQAAAVADFRPRAAAAAGMKWRRESGPISLELEPTPDLLAGCAAARRPGQWLVGFALEPKDLVLSSARRKLERKGVDMVVGNPLETMDGESIEAVVLTRDGGEHRTPGAIGKDRFAGWLLDLIEGTSAATAGWH